MMVEHKGEIYYTSKEVCEVIGYTRSTLMKRVQAGKIHQIIVKGKALYLKDEIDSLKGDEDHLLYNEKTSVKMRPKQLAELLDIDVSTVYRRVKKGMIKAERCGSYLVFTEENLEELISEMNAQCKERGTIVNEQFRVV